MSAVHVGQRVDFTARSEQRLRNFNGVRRSFLAIAFDAVRGDLMKKRGPMQRRVEVRHPRRTDSNQFGMFAQQRLQCGNVTVDDRFDIFRQRRPTLEIVPASDVS